MGATVDHDTQRLLQARLVVGALAVSVVVYGVVLLVVPSTGQGVEAVIVRGVTAAAAASALAVFALRKALMGSTALRAPPLGSVANRLGMDELEKELVAATARYHSGTVVGCAIAESVAIFGFALAFLSGEPARYLPFGAVSLALILLQWPRAAGRDCLLTPEARATLESRGR